MQGVAMRDWDKFMVRLPPGVREQIKALAKENGRSMNAEIIADIEAAMQIKGVQLERAS